MSDVLTDEEMGITGGADVLTDEEMEPAKPEIHGAASTAAINALDSTSLFGVPSVIAAKDAVFGEESAKASKTTSDDDPLFKAKGIVDKYRSNKRWLEKGMDRAREESPVAALAGQFAPALIPGPKGAAGLGGMMKRGAMLGAAHGALGGSADTAGGDIGGTVRDTVLGGAAGALGEGLGAAGGKFVQWVGKKAGNRLSSEVTKRIASLLGKYGQRKKDAVQAMKNLALQEGVEKLPQAAAQTPAGKILEGLKQKFPGVEADLYDASAGNAAKQVRRFVGSQSRFGTSAIPDKQYAAKLALRNMNSASKRAIKDMSGALLRITLGGAVGSAVLGDRMGQGGAAAFGGALAGGGKLWATRKTASAIMDHPKMLAAMARYLPSFGERLARGGGNLGAVSGYLMAALATDPGQEALSMAAAEVALDDGLVQPEDLGIEPIADRVVESPPKPKFDPPMGRDAGFIPIPAEVPESQRYDLKKKKMLEEMSGGTL